MPASKLVPLTPVAKKYLWYLLSFAVTLGVGFAPLWGGKVPGFHAILDVYPKSQQQKVIPFASILMSVTALAVQFFRGFAPPRHLKAIFIGVLVLFIVSVFGCYIAYDALVIQIEVPAIHGTAAYLVGSKPLPTCECAKRGLEIRQCIGFAISADPDEVAQCFSREEISKRSMILSVLYMLVMWSFAALVGLLILKEAPKVQPPGPRTRRA
jgi:hypothetical protein